MKMGQRTTQRILECSVCHRTPDDGEYLWEMCGEYMCADCVDKDHEETPELFAGTMDTLNNLSIIK